MYVRSSHVSLLSSALMACTHLNDAKFSGLLAWLAFVVNDTEHPEHAQNLVQALALLRAVCLGRRALRLYATADEISLTVHTLLAHACTRLLSSLFPLEQSHHFTVFFSFDAI